MQKADTQVCPPFFPISHKDITNFYGARRDVTFKGVLSATARKLQTFLCFKKVVPLKITWSKNSIKISNSAVYLPCHESESSQSPLPQFGGYVHESPETRDQLPQEYAPLHPLVHA